MFSANSLFRFDPDEPIFDEVSAESAVIGIMACIKELADRSDAPSFFSKYIREDHMWQLPEKDKQIEQMRLEMRQMQDECSRRIRKNTEEMNDQLKKERIKYDRLLDRRMKDAQAAYQHICEAQEESENHIKQMTWDMLDEIDQLKNKYEAVIQEKDDNIMRLERQVLRVHREGCERIDELRSEMSGRLTRCQDMHERSMHKKEAAYEKMIVETKKAHKEERELNSRMFRDMQEQLKSTVAWHCKEMDTKNNQLREIFSELTRAHDKITEIQDLRAQESLEYAMERKCSMMVMGEVMQSLEGGERSVPRLTYK